MLLIHPNTQFFFKTELTHHTSTHMLVESMNEVHDSEAGGVEVNDRWPGVQAEGVQFVTLAHGQLGESGKVPLPEYIDKAG